MGGFTTRQFQPRERGRRIYSTGAKWVPDTIWIFSTAETSLPLRRIKPPIVQPILFYIKYTTHTQWSLALRSTFEMSFLTSQNVTLTWFRLATFTKATRLWEWVNKEGWAHQHIYISYWSWRHDSDYCSTCYSVFKLIGPTSSYTRQAFCCTRSDVKVKSTRSFAMLYSIYPKNLHCVAAVLTQNIIRFREFDLDRLSMHKTIWTPKC
jgi:hypothetical protein